MTQKQPVILVPIDSRPITYLFPQMIACMAGIDVIMPARTMLGHRQTPADVEALHAWLNNILKTTQPDCPSSCSPDCLIICLDSLIYGGLVASRRCEDSLNVLLQRMEYIAEWKRISNNNLKILAQSSIMRIADNYSNNAEKSYWSQYGREIFLWSELLYKQDRGLLEDSAQLQKAEERISAEVRKDYLASRERNFQVNLNLVNYAKSQSIDFLVFSQDDTGKYGLNVSEREELLAQCKHEKLANVIVHIGTDEVLMLLLCRWLAKSSHHKPRCSVHFNCEQAKTVSSNYEGRTIGESVFAQIAAAMLEVVQVSRSEAEDFAVIVHAGKSIQGDHIWLPGHPDNRVLNTTDEVEKTMQLLNKITVPCVVCDVAYANGSDPLLVEKLMERKDLLTKLWGYAGWNTTGNTIGTALALGVARWYAKQYRVGAELKNKQAMFVRFADDWAYQTQVRTKFSEFKFSETSEEESRRQLHKLMRPCLDRLTDWLGYKPKDLRLSFPWQRSFEVEIDIHE